MIPASRERFTWRRVAHACSVRRTRLSFHTLRHFPGQSSGQDSRAAGLAQSAVALEVPIVQDRRRLDTRVGRTDLGVVNASCIPL